MRRVNNATSSPNKPAEGATGAYTRSNGAQGASPGQGGENFSQVLANTRQAAAPLPRLNPVPVNRWNSLNFLNTARVPPVRRPWTYSNMQQLVDTAAQAAVQSLSKATTFLAAPVIQQLQSIAPLKAAAVTDVQPAAGAMSLADYPHPPGDNGKGIHWIPTVSQSAPVVDRYVREAADMGMKWVLFLNEGGNIGANDYLVKRLTEAGIEPMMRIYTPGVVPVQGDIQKMVEHYTNLGVHYFQIYNEPNLRVETGGQPADVKQYVALWSQVAEQVLAGGGLPGFGALSPQGEMDDRQFLKEALQQLKATGKEDLLNRGWLAMHNYTGPRSLDDPDGFLRFQQYDDILQESLGRQLPIIGTEGGTHVSPYVTEQQQIDMMLGAYEYMQHREPYNFAYTYWIIANGHDAAWDEHALFRPDGPTALARALKETSTTGGLV